jgi:hypothetical protein
MGILHLKKGVSEEQGELERGRRWRSRRTSFRNL